MTPTTDPHASQQRPEQEPEDRVVSGSRELGVLRRVPASARGYDVLRVRDFLARAQASLETLRKGGSYPELSSAEVREIVFPAQDGGYDAETVDALMDEVEDELAAAERARLDAVRGPDAVRQRAEPLADLIMGRLNRPDGRRFRRPARRRDIGYLAADVDALCAQLAEHLRVSEHPHPGAVRTAAFREGTGTRAYDEAQVDAFLERVQELIQLIR